MTIETFKWTALNGATGDVTFKVLTAQFGDGYKQTAVDGLNSRSESWPLTFTGPKVSIQAIKDFLDRHAGAKSFYWTPPLGEQALFKAGKYSAQPLGGSAYTVTVTFDEDFKP